MPPSALAHPDPAELPAGAGGAAGASPLRHLFHPAHAEEYAAGMRLAVDHLTQALQRVRGPATGVSAHRAAEPVRVVDLDQPLPGVADALEEMSRVWLDDTVWFHEAGYQAHLNCPVVIPAALAEVFVSAVNPSLDTFDQSVAGTFIERHLVEWTARRAGLGDAADGVFTSGGTQSNLQALHLARDTALERHGADALGRLRLFVSEDGHVSIDKAARLLGLAPGAVIGVPVDERRRMRVDALADAMSRARNGGLVPAAVVATAGTTDFGAIDPLPDCASQAAAYGAWLHVDAAYGGGLLVSRRRRPLLAGIERADSVTVDYHKTWFQPVSASAVLVRDRRHLGHVTAHADYLNPADAGGARAHQPNQVDKSLQTTRRFDALKVWLTLRVLGPDTIGDWVDDLVDLADAAWADLLDHPRLQLAARPELSTLLLRYRPAGRAPEPDEDAADALVPAIRAALYERGSAMVAATTVDGRRWLKLTLLNPLATVEDVHFVAEQIVAAGDALTGAGESGPAGSNA